MRYAYDPWGKCTVLLDATDSLLSIRNPFRYRGYYYDQETELYYLQNRYYDPETGRFISPDKTKYLDPTSITGLNLYTYCGNNPVMYVDPSGNSVLAFFLILAAGAIIGGTIAAVVSVSDGKQGWELASDIFLGASIGLAVVGAAISLTGVVAGAIGGTAVTILGANAVQIFAVGALGFNFTAFVTAPLYGIKMEGMELGSTNTNPLPSSNPVYSHPALSPKPKY